MALPTTITTQAAAVMIPKPFKSSGGNFYAIVAETINTIDAYKATDPTDSWTVQDAANNPSDGQGIAGVTAIQDGDIIHIAFIDGLRAYYYSTFDMSDDTWGTINEEIEFPTNTATFPWISIAVRSDGDVVVVYAGDTDQVMGGKKERVDVNIRTGVTWGGPVALDAAGDIHYGNPNVVIGPLTDDMHIIWQQTTNIADPPTIWANRQARTLDPSDTLSTTDTTGAAGTSLSLLGASNSVAYDDSGTQRIIGHGIKETTGSVHSRQYALATEDGSDYIALNSEVDDASGADPSINGEISPSTLVELSGDLHQLFAGGGTGGGDRDLYYTKSTDDGATWSTPTEEIDAINVNFISANIYVRGADTVLAYVYDDAGVQKYNEKVLIAGVVDLIQPPLLHSFAVTRSTHY